MSTKVLELMNNYPDGRADENMGGLVGRYCVLGYYDALDADLHIGGKEGSADRLSSWKSKNDVGIRYLTGSGKITSLCMYPEQPAIAAEEGEREEKEKNVWDEDNTLPLLVVSMVRMKETNGMPEFVRAFNGRSNMVAYYSYEHCEAAVVFRANSYRGVIENIRSLYASGDALKVYSMLAIPEKILKEPEMLKERLQEEDVLVRMNASMKDREAMERFYRLLKGALEENRKGKPEGKLEGEPEGESEENSERKQTEEKAGGGLKENPAEEREEKPKVGHIRPELHMEKYDLLGDDDLLIEINHVVFGDILPMYAANGLLSHQNKAYSDAFFNVESRFLLPGGTNLERIGTEQWKKGEADGELRSEEERAEFDVEQRNEEAQAESDVEKRNEEAWTEFAGKRKSMTRREDIHVDDSRRKIGWILDDMNRLKKLYEDPRYRNEDALLSYMICMIRLLNSMVQISTSQLHRYERKILFEPMKTFMNYFIGQVETVIGTGTDDMQKVSKKNKQIRNIETAVCRVADIFENVLNGTANTDKQMFLSLPVNSSIYEISPKLYAFYADLIADLQKIFDKDRQYAFFLNPTLKRILQEEVLFDDRTEKGKVVIIDVPVRMLDDTEFLPLYMIHETFHVLTTEERQRKLRSLLLYACLESEVSERIFVGVSFFDNDKADLYLKDALLRNWLTDIIEQGIRLYDRENWDSRQFYGKNINRTAAGGMEKSLLRIEKNVLSDIVSEIKKRNGIYGEHIRSFNAFDPAYRRLCNQAEIVKDNVRYMLYHQEVIYFARRLMFLFKESYADAAMLLVGGYSIDHYEAAFLHAAQFDVQSDQFEMDHNMIIRKTLARLVAESRRDDMIRDGELTNLGLTAYRRMAFELRQTEKSVKGSAGVNSASGFDGEAGNEGDNEFYENCYRQSEMKYAIMTPGCFRCMLEYLFECSEKLKATLGGLSAQDREILGRLRSKLRLKNYDIISGSRFVDFGIE